MSASKSLDPRINRLQPSREKTEMAKPGYDQLATYEVFIQSSERTPLQHAGIVHADDAELAFVFAKEQYTRRGRSYLGLCVAPTMYIWKSATTDDQENIYDASEHDFTTPGAFDQGSPQTYQVFHLLKRGKQHQHAGEVEGANIEAAFSQARRQFKQEQPVYNVWLIPQTSMYLPEEDLTDIWDTLSEKTYREPVDYRAGDRLKHWRERPEKL